MILQQASRLSTAWKWSSCFLSSQVSSAKREIEVVKRLKGLVDPGTNRAIQSIGVLQSIKVTDSKINIRLDFFVPGYPFEAETIKQIQHRLCDLDWATDIVFELEAPKKCSGLNSVSIQETTLSKVAHIIGVSSCKGGVGKSTVAANLAITMSNMGLRVGILDADIYGPSLPTLMPAVCEDVQRSPSNPKHVLPLHPQHCPDLKMLSFGHVNPKSGAPGAGGKVAAVVRGPIASRIINQLLLSTEWGDLDYLVIDMPPGTGDVQITLSQSACLSGAVVVTTPHRLSLVDAAKGVAMFEELKIPTLAVVENMAHFTCEHGTRYHPFGRGGRENLLAGCRALLGEEVTQPVGGASKLGGCGNGQPHSHPVGESCGGVATHVSSNSVAFTAAQGISESYLRLQHCPLHSLPLTLPESTTGEDALLPVSVAAPQSDAAATYRAIAHDVIVEVFKTQMGALLVPTITVSNGGENLILRYYGASRTTEYAIPSCDLRARDPVTGKVRMEVGGTVESTLALFKGVHPLKLDIKGQYGVAVVWSDGHFADIFPYDVLRNIAEEVSSQRNIG